MLTFEPDVTCSAVVVVDEDDAYPCGVPSRYQVARSDGDESYGINGGSDEACEEHLAEAVAGMVDGDENVWAIVTIRWNDPENPCPACGSEVRTEHGLVPSPTTGRPVGCPDGWHYDEA